MKSVRHETQKTASLCSRLCLRYSVVRCLREFVLVDAIHQQRRGRQQGAEAWCLDDHFTLQALQCVDFAIVHGAFHTVVRFLLPSLHT